MRVCLGRFVPLSTEEFFGRSASVVFMGGCNWNCPYCNVPALLDTANCKAWDSSELLSEIAHVGALVDSVVFTGGEPTLQKDALISMCELVKSAGMYVKVQTNGSKPGVVAELITRDLVDRLGVDVKALFDDYAGMTGVQDPEVDKLRETLKSAKRYGIQWEAVIPVIKGINDDKIPEIAEQADAPLTVLRAFERGVIVDRKFKGSAPSRSELLKIAELCGGETHIRTKTYGEEAVTA